MQQEKWKKRLSSSTKLKIIEWIKEKKKSITPTTVDSAIRSLELGNLHVPSWFISIHLGGLSEEEEEKRDDENWKKSQKRVRELGPYLQAEMSKLHLLPTPKLTRAGFQYLGNHSQQLNEEESKQEKVNLAASAKKRAELFLHATKL